jgi:hypothetical protein
LDVGISTVGSLDVGISTVGNLDVGKSTQHRLQTEKRHQASDKIELAKIWAVGKIETKN